MAELKDLWCKDVCVWGGRGRGGGGIHIYI